MDAKTNELDSPVGPISQSRNYALIMFCLAIGAFSLKAMIAGHHILLNGFVIWACVRGVTEGFFWWYQGKHGHFLEAMHDLAANISTFVLFCWLAFSICYIVFGW